MRPTAKDPSQFEFPVGPKVPYEDPKRCVSLRAATKREACKSTKLCTKQGHGWKLFISGTPTKRTLLRRVGGEEAASTGTSALGARGVQEY